MMPEAATVYVLDDDPSVRKALTRLIESVGIATRAFSSANEFLEASLPDGPACLVLDVRMPGMSGLELQHALSTAEREVPIIFITGHGNVPMSVRAMKAGAVDFLEKPFDDQVLIDAIQGALERDARGLLEREERSRIEERVRTLTPREREVFALVVTGMLNKQIGGQLGTSEKTIKIHRARVMRKMRARSLAELVRLADRAGIRPPTPPPP